MYVFGLLVFGRGEISACFLIVGNIPVCIMVFMMLVIGAESVSALLRVTQLGKSDECVAFLV